MSVTSLFDAVQYAKAHGGRLCIYDNGTRFVLEMCEPIPWMSYHFCSHTVSGTGLDRTAVYATTARALGLTVVEGRKVGAA